MYQDPTRPLTFETLLSDPLTRMVMDADGVSPDDVIAVMEAAREARSARARPFIIRVVAGPLATSVPA
jgi:hypothetical protein